jgi:hypothetical protein
MIFSVAFIALYVGHHVGDYWVQTHNQAIHKGDAGPGGVIACISHVASYIVTQFVCVMLAFWVTGAGEDNWLLVLALAISGFTHYTADRREHGLMFKLARAMPTKRGYLEVPGGAAFLDQSWHIFFGVFVPALVISL